ncbi:hypothetical protein BsWGS_17396 [Bradybaena similaris]
MSSCCKSLFKASPNESSKQGQGRVKDTTTGQSKMALLLPVSCWQVIVQLLASDNEKLQKQLQYSQGDSKLSEREHVKITTRTRNIKLGGTHLNQPSRYNKCHGRETNGNDRQLVKLLSTIVSTCSPQRRTQALLTQAKSIRRQPSETRQVVTRITDASSQTVNQHCDSKPVTISIGVSRDTQTDTQTENRAVNTNVYFKQRQTVQSPPATQRSAVNEHLKQESADQGKPVQQEPKRSVVKNTQEERHCFFCGSSKHQIRFCELYLQKKSQRRGGKAVKPAKNREVAEHNGWSKEKRTDEMVTRSTTVTTNVAEQTKVSLPPPPLSKSLQAKANWLPPPTPLNDCGQIKISLPPPPPTDCLPPPPPNNGGQTSVSVPSPQPNEGNQTKLSSNDGRPTNFSLPPPPPPPTPNDCVQTEVSSSPPARDIAQTIVTSTLPIKTPEISKGINYGSTQQTKEQKPKWFGKFPRNSQDLADFTRHQISQLVSNNEICIPENSLPCRQCKKKIHTLPECESARYVLRQRTKECVVCGLEHDMTTCEFIRALDIAHLLTKEHRQKLFKVCPYLQDVIDKPVEWYAFVYMWKNVAAKVGRMDPALFGVKSIYR